MSVFGVMYKMGYFRENLHTKQKIPQKNPLHRLWRFPSPKGKAMIQASKTSCNL